MKPIVLILATAALLSSVAMAETNTVPVNRKEKPSRFSVLDLTSSHEKRREVARQSIGVEELSSDGKATNRTEATCQTNLLSTVGAAAERDGYGADDNYRLHIGDKLTFQVLEDRETAKILVIADSGELEVPYMGRIPALDKTCHQLATRIKAELEKEYYYHASIGTGVGDLKPSARPRVRLGTSANTRTD